MRHRGSATDPLRLRPFRRIGQTCKISPVAATASYLDGCLCPAVFGAKINDIPPYGRLQKLQRAVADPGCQIGPDVTPESTAAAVFRARTAWLKKSRAGIFEVVERK